MPTQGLDIGLQIRNNTNYPQQINVMGNPTNLLDTANATIEYRWDLTGFSVTFQNTVSVQYRRNTDPAYETFTWDLDGTSLQGIVLALNNLGIGYFNLYDELGSTYIGTYNQNYEFGDLNIFNPSISTTTTTTTTTIAPTTTTTTTSTTTAAPTTSTTTTTTTAAPTTTTSTTTTTTTNLVYSQFTLGYSALNGNDSCAEFVLTPTSFYAVGGTITLVNGTILYTDTGLTTLVPNGFYSNGSDNWSVVSGNGTLSAQNSCALTTTTTTTTTTAAPTTTSTTSTTTTAAPTTTSTTTSTTTAVPFSTYSLQPSNIDQAQACSDYPAGLVNFYTAFGATLQNGTIIYTDTALITPAPNGYYSNGALSWDTSGGTGVLANESACNIISYGIGYNIFNGGSSYTGYNTSNDSCLAGGTGGIVIVYSNGVINDGEVLFLDAALTIPFVSTGGYYWASGGIGIYYYFTYASQIVGFTSCPTTTTSTTTTTTTSIPTTSTTTTTTTAPTTSTTTTTTTAIPIYTYLGGTNPSSASSVSACAAYSTIRGYLCLTTPISSIGLGDIFYDSYPSTPTNGGNNWIALKTGGVGDAYTFQIDSLGVVIGVGGNCNATTTTTTSTTTTTTTAAPVPYTIDNAATGSSLLACAGLTTTSIVYALAGYNVPIVGMIFYDSPSLTTPFVGSVGWRKFTNGVTDYAGEVDINGELTNYVTCPTTTSTTTTTTTAAPLPANIFIINGSLDVAVSQVDFNGVTATFVGGQPLPNTTGNGTNLNTTQIGTYTLDVYRNNTTPTQHITVTDSNGTPQCMSFSSGSAIESYGGVVYDGVTNIQIDVQDGVC